MKNQPDSKAETVNRAGVTVIFPASAHPNAVDAWLARRGVSEGARWIVPTTPGGVPVTIFYGGR
jgi:hypothetical protein